MSSGHPTTAEEGIRPEIPASPGRLASLDVFRGLTVAGMILVNNAGSAGDLYPTLRHAQWDGWTPTDLVFPFFLFIVGVSITFALSKRMDDPEARRGVLARIFRRSLIIFGLGIALGKFPYYQDFFHSARIPGVLQRIALCYLATSLIFLRTRARGQAITLGVLLVGYWLVMTQVPVPGSRAGDLRRGHDLASYVDRAVFIHGEHKHLYKDDYVPEGLLSTLPAIATTLLGVLAGHWLRSGRPPFEVDAGLFVAGTISVVLGWAWGGIFPINKALWTSSYVLLSGGLAMIGLALCYWAVDLQGYRRWAYPFRAFGANAIAAYTLASAGARLLNLPLLTRPDARPISVHQLLYDDYFHAALSDGNAALAYAATLVLACFLIVAVLDLMGLHIRA